MPLNKFRILWQREMWFPDRGLYTGSALQARIWVIANCGLKERSQGHPTDLFLTISVLQRKFCWLGAEVSAVLLGSKVLNLRSRIYQMYQKFLLEIFYPSNLLEIFLGCISSWVSGVIGSSQVAPLCARIMRVESRADDLFTADQKICAWAPLLVVSGPPARAKRAWDRAPYSWNMVNLFSFGCHVIDRAYVRTRLQIVWVR